jgi:hypothetical protein
MRKISIALRLETLTQPLKVKLNEAMGKRLF